MFIKTVSTTSGINPIKFDETGGVFYWILNTGSSTIYASTKSAFTAGDDGVVSLGPKESRRLETNNDTIYILGEGQVEIHNQRDGICSFKQAPTSSGSGGGGTIDAYTKTESDAKYAQKTDIPSSLPANGGNADTLDGLHSNEIAINPNLLINPDFKINQRGVVSGDTLVYGRYSLDRWHILYNNLDFKKSINITSDGIELVTTNGAGNGYYGDFHHIFENPLPSGYYTMSGKIDGVIRTYTGYLAENADSILFDGAFVLAHTSFAIRFYDDTRKIEWVKLEVGQVATQFVPPDPALELVKCQRFYAAGEYAFDKMTKNINYAIVNVQFPVKMRTKPTVTIYSMNGTVNTISEWASHIDAINDVYANGADLDTSGFASIISVNSFVENAAYKFKHTADAEIY